MSAATVVVPGRMRLPPIPFAIWRQMSPPQSISSVAERPSSSATIGAPPSCGVRRCPDKVAAVAGLSVPFIPRGPASFIDVAKAMYKDRFFYQLYFQAEGVAEAEFEADIPAALRKVYFAISGAAPLNKWLEHKPADAKLLDGMIDPVPFPNWMSEKDLQVYVEAFRTSGFRGPLNRYRAQNIDFQEMAEFTGKPVTQPSYFVGGERDAVRAFIPGMDLYANPQSGCTDFRGSGAR